LFVFSGALILSGDIVMVVSGAVIITLVVYFLILTIKYPALTINKDQVIVRRPLWGTWVITKLNQYKLVI
jgi:succinate dehydrogenase hydrophobic anchor subunit